MMIFSFFAPTHRISSNSELRRFLTGKIMSGPDHRLVRRSSVARRELLGLQAGTQ